MIRIVAFFAGVVFLALWLVTQVWPTPPASNSEVLGGLSRALIDPVSGFDDRRFERLPGETDLAYATRATALVHAAIYHCQYLDFDQTWMTALVARFFPAFFSRDVGILDPAGLRCGFCHQVAFVLAEILARNGIDTAQAWGLIGHVVTRFEIDGMSYCTDPDYGVGPFPTPWDDPEILERIVTAYYRNAITEEEKAAIVIDAYVTVDDNARYYTMPRLRSIAAEQRAILQYQRPIEHLLLVSGLLCFGLALMYRRRWLLRFRPRTVS